MEHQINEEIRDAEIRLIGADGAQLGIMTAQQALQIAEENDLDLVKIAPQAVPPYVKSWTTANTVLSRPSGKRTPAGTSG